MESSLHTMASLFAQLGLPADADAIGAFIRTHRPLEGSLALHEAPFWTAAQAEFLLEEILEDADWAPVVDLLNAELRA